MWSLTHFLRKKGDQDLLSFVDSPLRGELRYEKKHFLYCGRFRLVLVVFTNTKTFMEGERKYTRSTKHLNLTSLAFMQLVPSDDRAVRHICIRCILFNK